MNANQKSSRLLSLDALRGFDMLWIMGFARVFRGYCMLWPDGKDWALYHQMCHVQWGGLALYDTIFPLFIFIAGISFPFSYAKQVERGVSRGGATLRVLKRLALLLLLGMIYNGLLYFKFENFRYASVLGKIGLAWATAALIYVWFGLRGRIVALVAFLAGYWAMLQLTAPDAPAGMGPFTLEGCYPGYLDRLGFTPGYLYCDNKLEPSGVVVSVCGSTASALFGLLAGDLVRTARFSGERKAALLALVGVIALAAGWALSFNCPIIKNLWTPSFTLVCAGIGFLLFAAFYWLIDVKGRVAWSFPLRVIGVNAIAIYMLQQFVDFMKVSKFFCSGVASWFATPDFVLAIGYTAACWLVLWFLNRHKVYFKV